MYKTDLLDHAINIAEELMASGLEDTDCFSWDTINLSLEGEVSWTKNESIYNGNSGIGLFFLELWHHTLNPRHKQVAIKAMQWSIDYSKSNETDFYAFYTGRMGVVYSLLRFYESFRDKFYLDTAVHLSLNVDRFLKVKNSANDLMNGLAGTVLGLMHLHSFVKETWILNSIEAYIFAILKNARTTKNGNVYWDKSPKFHNGLCGFSHGSSGIGYVFIELGKYFNNPTFTWIGEKAFAFENDLFDPVLSNWPDFRSDFDLQPSAYFDAYEKKMFNRFLPGDMVAWCHGAPGIALARMRAFEILKKRKFQRDHLTALKKTTLNILKSDYASISLCHGIAGNASVLLESYKLTNDPELLKVSMEGVRKILDSRDFFKLYRSGYHTVSSTIEDPSLFMGKAGIGYFFLQCLSPRKTRSILKFDTVPEGIKAEQPGINLKLKELKQIILSYRFPKTSLVVREMGLDVEFLFSKEYARVKIKNGSENINNYKQLVAEALRLDVAVGKLIQKNYSKRPLWAFVKKMHEFEQSKNILNLDYHLLINEKVVCSTACQILSSRLIQNSAGFIITKRYPIVALCLAEDRVDEFVLSEFSSMVLKKLKAGKSIKQLQRELKKGMKISLEDTDAFDKLVFDQVVNGLRAGLLVSSK